MEAQLESYSVELKRLGFPSDQPLEALRRHIAALDDQLSSLKGEQEAALRNIQLDEGKRVQYPQRIVALCLQPLTEEYKLELAGRIQAENDERKKTASQLRTKIERLQQLKNTANNTFSTLQMLSPRAEELGSRIKEETDVLVEFSNELDDKQRLEKDLHAQLDTLRFELKRYDISEVETAKTRRDQAFRQYYILTPKYAQKRTARRT